MYRRRVTVFVGHFGSGKTEIALNGALELAESGHAGDPCRSRRDQALLSNPFRAGHSCRTRVSSCWRPLAPTSTPISPSSCRKSAATCATPRRRLIMDVGGDDVGARVLGSLSDVVPIDDTDCLLVLNFRRPSTPDPERALKMVRDIEGVGRVPVTGLISNTHLMDETTPEVVLDGYRLGARDRRSRRGAAGCRDRQRCSGGAARR